MRETQPGRVEVSTAQFGRLETWLRVTHPQDPDPDRLPVVVLHGGPGMAHNYCLPMTTLCGDGRRVVHYDQVGCGRSTHLPAAPADFWTVDLFVAELRNLVEHLDLRDGFHLLGQSWGGMLAPEYVLAHPDGVRSLTLCDSPASMPLWCKGTNELLSGLPEQTRRTIERHETAGTTGSQEYLAAVDEFYRRHLCRVHPFPQDLADSFLQMEEDPTVYHTMIGPSEFHVTGSLGEWSVVDRLGGIDLPVLVLAGEHDEATPDAWAPFVEKIPNARHHVFPGASHTPHIETPQEFTRVVGEFLRQHD